MSSEDRSLENLDPESLKFVAADATFQWGRTACARNLSTQMPLKLLHVSGTDFSWYFFISRKPSAVWFPEAKRDTSHANLLARTRRKRREDFLSTRLAKPDHATDLRIFSPLRHVRPLVSFEIATPAKLTPANLGKQLGSARCVSPLHWGIGTEDGPLRVILQLRLIVDEKIANHSHTFRKVFIYDTAELRVLRIQNPERLVQREPLAFSAEDQPTIHGGDRDETCSPCPTALRFAPVREVLNCDAASYRHRHGEVERRITVDVGRPPKYNNIKRAQHEKAECHRAEPSPWLVLPPAPEERHQPNQCERPSHGMYPAEQHTANPPPPIFPRDILPVPTFSANPAMSRRNAILPRVWLHPVNL